MIKVLVICAVIAAGSALEDGFFSEKLKATPEYVSTMNLFNGSFTTKLDHFSPQDRRVVRLDYRVNIDFFTDGGPLFFNLNNGYETTTQWIEEGLVYDVARNVGGALITADHRYFGMNNVTGSLSFDDLRFLSVDQAVADVAALVSNVREHLGATDNKVFVWGTGYGATLATYSRKKFPHLIDGAFASSGLFRAEVSDESYFDNLSALLYEHGGAVCHGRVQNAFNILEYLIENAESDYLQQRLNLCAPLETDNDQEIGLLIEGFVLYISTYFRNNHVFGLQNFCRDMNYFPEDTLNSLIRWVMYIYEQPECYNSDYEQYIDVLVDTRLDAPLARLRTAAYLRCTQIGAFRIPSDYEMTAFPQLLTDEYHFRVCEDIFGEDYDRDALQIAVENLNLIFGGQQQVVSHVVYTNAGLDPWISHGISEHGTVESTAIFLYFSSSGADLSSISLDEPIELTRAKREITEFLTRWSTED